MSATRTWPQKTRELQTRLFDSRIWNDFQFRDDDIIIATHPKAGSHWLKQIVGQLLAGGDPALDTGRLSPLVDGHLPPKEVKLAMLEAQTQRRCLMTHLPADAMRIVPQARYLYVGRDGRDVAWSYYNHHTHISPALRDQLNALPIEAPLMEPPPSDIRTFWRLWLDRPNYPLLSFWEHIRTWWAVRDLPNLLLLHYATLKRDLPGEIRRIATFLEIPIDETRWDTILEYCSFAWMKSHASNNTTLRAGFAGDGTSFFHSGTNGRWSDVLSPADVAEYEARAERELGPDCAHWLATGELPSDMTPPAT